jgi:hypothetical protein
MIAPTEKHLLVIWLKYGGTARKPGSKQKTGVTL